MEELAELDSGDHSGELGGGAGFDREFAAGDQPELVPGVLDGVG